MTQYTVFVIRSHPKKNFFSCFFTCIFISPTECAFARVFIKPIRCVFVHKIQFCVYFRQKTDKKAIRKRLKNQNIDIFIPIRIKILIFYNIVLNKDVFTNRTQKNTMKSRKWDDGTTQTKIADSLRKPPSHVIYSLFSAFACFILYHKKIILQKKNAV